MANDDLALIAARFGAALRSAGVPADPGRCERFASAVTVARPATRYELYLCAQATLASAQAQIETLERVFAEVFGGLSGPVPAPGPPAPPPGPDRPPSTDDLLAQAARSAQTHPGPPGGPGDEQLTQGTPVGQDATDGEPDPRRPGRGRPPGAGQPGRAAGGQGLRRADPG